MANRASRSKSSKPATGATAARAARTAATSEAETEAGAGAGPDARPRDPRRWIYGGLDVVFTAVYVVLLWKVIPNRLPSAALHLWTFPLASLAMAIGTLLGSRRGWWLAVAGGSLALASMIALIVRILISAAFLAGVYGAFGKAAATFAFVMIALAVEIVALLPIVQVKWLMSRAGRRALGRPRPVQ